MNTRPLNSPPRLAALAIALAASALLAACGGGGGPPQMPPTEVNVATVVAKRVAQWDEFTGRIEAIESVEIRPRVAGYLAGVHFEDGAVVQRGDLLFTIDDREYRAAADSAQAAVASAATRVEVARTEFARTEKLAAARAASTEELEQRRGELQRAEADLKATEAQARQAALNLGFTRVTSPIDGRASLARLRVGNLVGAGDPVLTTVVSLDPVFVTFRGDERAYLRYQDMAREGSRPSSREVQNPVRVALAHRHHPRARRTAEPRRPLHPGPVRARAAAGLGRARRAAGPSAGGADRPGPPLRLRRRAGDVAAGRAGLHRRGAQGRGARSDDRRPGGGRAGPRANRPGGGQRHAQDLLPRRAGRTGRGADGRAEHGGGGARGRARRRRRQGLSHGLHAH